MISNEERREVAAMLRKAEIENVGITYSAHLGAVIGECVRLVSGHECLVDKGLAKLADLIEPEPISGETSDGYHTFNELYHHRALLFSVVVRNYPELCWKSKKHHTGDMYDGMFIVGINTPDGQASYHYDIEPYWDMFDCEELEFAPEWDGHTPDQAIERIGKLTRHNIERTCNLVTVTARTEFCGGFSQEFKVPGCSVCENPLSANWQYCPYCGAKVMGER